MSIETAVRGARDIADRNSTGTAADPGVEAIVAALRSRGGSDPPALAGHPLRGCSLVGADLSGVDLSRLDLREADLSRCDLRGARLVGARLAGATLFGANLEGAELLSADLSGADLTEARAGRAGFGDADLSGATLFDTDLAGATFAGADLSGADARAAGLRGARLRGAVLTGADLSRADLTGADLECARVEHASFRDADLREARLRGLRGFDRACFVGADIQGVDPCGAYLVVRDIRDQNYLHEFRTQSRTGAVVYWIWWATSDCGRSFVRWGLWTVLIAALFAGAFELAEFDRGDHPTPITSIYYSVVTLTTLGYGDVVPASVPAQLLSIAEVVVGYVMLGGLLSIFSTKMGRRAD